MGSFEFQVKGNGDRRAHTIQVRNSQVEIDGGFEGKTSFALIEGKNVVHSNFLIRQLYYPYRLWQERIRKNVRPVFMVYSNSIFRLLEYAFSDICDYNSIQLVREKRYSLEDVEISREDLLRVFRQTRPQPEPKVTFIQADSFPKVISLVEHLKEKAMTTGEIAELFGFRPRQFLNMLDPSLRRRVRKGGDSAGFQRNALNFYKPFLSILIFDIKVQAESPASSMEIVPRTFSPPSFRI